MNPGGCVWIQENGRKGKGRIWGGRIPSLDSKMRGKKFKRKGIERIVHLEKIWRKTLISSFLFHYLLYKQELLLFPSFPSLPLPSLPLPSLFFSPKLLSEHSVRAAIAIYFLRYFLLATFLKTPMSIHILTNSFSYTLVQIIKKNDKNHIFQTNLTRSYFT